MEAVERKVTVEPVEPDLRFIRTLIDQGAATLKNCMQCGTCSATCALSPDRRPFPGKEMAWAAWGRKDRLLADPDVWLCHQCNDCSERCPRGARPGDVLAVLRQECVRHYAVPGFLGDWAGRGRFFPLLIALPATLLIVAVIVRKPIEDALGLARETGDRIVYPYSIFFPHWLLNTLFAVVTGLAVLALLAGAVRYWRALEAAQPRIRDEEGRNDVSQDDVSRNGGPRRGFLPGLLATLKVVLTHEKFSLCERTRTRSWSHLCVLYGFLALCLVTAWIILSLYNPFLSRSFIYPFSFWSPWKIMANAGGLAILLGCALMIWDRFREGKETIGATWFDWSLISLLVCAVITGFITETLHYVRLEPHRHLAYFLHLMFVLAFLFSLPYSKLAHVAYRTTALIHAEMRGRKIGESDGSVNSPAAQESGHALLATILVIALLVPLGITLVRGALPADPAPGVFLEKAETDEEGCVKETEFMRYHHWELLREIRKEVVRYGKRGTVGLATCKDCHRSRERFCNRCHEAATVVTDCFGCHYYP